MRPPPRTGVATAPFRDTCPPLYNQITHRHHASTEQHCCVQTKRNLRRQRSQWRGPHHTGAHTPPGFAPRGRVPPHTPPFAAASSALAPVEELVCILRVPGCPRDIGAHGQVEARLKTEDPRRIVDDQTLDLIGELATLVRLECRDKSVSTNLPPVPLTF